MSIGERISELRKKNNMSQSQLAQMLEVSRQAVSKWENDTAAPDTIKLIQLADALDSDVEYLATGKHRIPKVITVVENVEVEKLVEVERIVEVERVVETVVERPVIKKVKRIKYIRNPLEFGLCGIAGLILGLVIGLLF